MRAIRRGIFLAITLLSMTTIAVAQDLSLNDFGDQALIRVQGIGRVSVLTDMAIVSLGVETPAKTAAEARQKAAEAMTEMMTAVRAQSVADKDIQTQHLSLNPIYAPDGAGKITGYMAQHQLSVKVRDLTAVGTVIDEALKASGEAGRMYGLSFGVDDTSAAETDARARAYTNALSKATELAKAAGVGLGRPIRIVESSAGMPGPVPMPGGMMARMAADTATPIASGEQEVAVSVDVVYVVNDQGAPTASAPPAPTTPAPAPAAPPPTQ